MRRFTSLRAHDVVPRFGAVGLLAGLMMIPVLAGCPGSLGSGAWQPPPGYGTSGTGGTTAPPMGTGGMMAASGCDAPTMYFKSTDASTGCALAGACHDAMGAALSKLNLVDAGVWTRLVGVAASSTLGPKCVGMPYVNNAKPASGVLLTRVGVVDGCGAGTLMPLGSTAVNQPILDCITSWVNSQLP